MTRKQEQVLEARRELRLRLGHAFQHGFDGKHHHLNVDGFMRELERFIDAKIDEALHLHRRQRS